MHKFNFLIVFLCLFAFCIFSAFAQESLDSVVVDSLTKVPLDYSVNTNFVDTNKVERIDMGIERRNLWVKDYFLDGFVVEAAYAAPTAFHLSLWGIRIDKLDDGQTLKKYDFLYGVPIVSFDVDECMVSDEGILSLILFFAALEKNESAIRTLFKLDYLLFGNTYFSLSDNGRFGLFEKHRILDYGIYSLTTNGKAWEFGFSEALGLRIVLSKNYRRSGYYFDLGAHVRVTNQRFRYGVFVQLGSFGSSK